MKKTSIASAIIAGALFSAQAIQAQNFNLKLEHMYGDVYESLSGVIIVSDKYCEVPDYTSVILHYYDNPANSNTIRANNSDANSGGLDVPLVSSFYNSYERPSSLIDNFTYEVEEAVLISPKSCNEAFGACDEPSDFEPYIDYRAVTKTCQVYGVARLGDSGTDPINNNSRVVYDTDSDMLYVTNIEIWTALENTGEIFSYVSMQYALGRFFVRDIEQ